MAWFVVTLAALTAGCLARQEAVGQVGRLAMGVALLAAARALGAGYRRARGLSAQ